MREKLARLVFALVLVAAAGWSFNLPNAGAGLAQTPGPDGYRINIPFIAMGEDPSLRAAFQSALGRFAARDGFAPQIQSIDQAGDWALSIFRLGVSMPGESQDEDIRYALANRQNGQWVVMLQDDPGLLPWLDQAPQSVLHPALRAMLKDLSAAANAGDARALAPTMADLKLPWLPKDNPRSISGYLYNEGTHQNGDAYAMDWGLVNNDVAAVAGGTVVERVCNLPNVRDDSKGYGNYILMDIGGNVFALYAHLQSCALNLNQTVPQGTVVGRSGTSGYSTGPHLHFRLRDGQYNPVKAEPISGYAPIEKGKSYYSNNGAPIQNVCEPGDEQVALYVDGGYQGQCVKLGIGDYPTPATTGLPNDSVSSIKVGASVLAVACKDNGFNGCETIPGSDSNLSDNAIGNDQLSSLRVTRRGGALTVVQALSLSSSTPAVGEAVRARFTIRNTGYQALSVQELTAGGRLGSDWNGTWADFPHTSGFTLQPGQEYQYDETRAFDQAGAYFAEPVVKSGDAWGGMSGANRVTFNVANRGRLEVVESLALTTTSAHLGETIQARFKVRNTGSAALVLEQLTAGGRRGSDWNGEWADFPSVMNIPLQPGQEYLYQQNRTFETEGGYFAEPVVKINGSWGGIQNANRVTFTILQGGRLQVVEPLSLSSGSPAVGEVLQARFVVKNVGSTALAVEQLTAGARRGRDWNGEWADFPSVPGFSLQPGQSYEYKQSRAFFAEGAHFVEPVVKIAGNWGGIGGAQRIDLQVSAGLQVTQNVILSSNPPQQDQTVTAEFKFRNAGSHPIAVYRVLAAGRGPDCADWNCARNADFPVSAENLLIQPGQEFDYRQTRSYSQTGGGYFLEPLMEVVPGMWVGLPGGGRISFEVVPGGKLQVVEALSLSTTSPLVGELVTAHFKLRNTGVLPVMIEQLTAGGRRGSDWDGEWADFPSVYNIPLQPGQEYAYNQSRTYLLEDGYFAEPVVKLNGNWGGIGGANRVRINVAPGLRISQPLVLSPASPQVGQPVSATFVIKNTGARPVTIGRLVAAVRKPGCDDFSCPQGVDFAVTDGTITFQPGQEITYRQVRTFDAAGAGYFAQPVMEVAPGWWENIPGSSQLVFEVRP